MHVVDVEMKCMSGNIKTKQNNEYEYHDIHSEHRTPSQGLILKWETPTPAVRDMILFLCIGALIARNDYDADQTDI